MKIDNTKNDKGLDIVVIQLNGRLDAQYSDSIEEELFQFINDGYKYLLIDMENINYLGSSGIRVLLGLSGKLSKTGGKLKILNMPETGIKILKTMELVARFDLYKDRKEAFNTF